MEITRRFHNVHKNNSRKLKGSMCVHLSATVCVTVCVCHVYMCVVVYMCLCAFVQAYCRPIMDLAGKRKFNCFACPDGIKWLGYKPFLLGILTPTIQLINFIAFAMRREWAE